MLEARPELTWRDVKHILASTAKKVDSSFAAIVTNSSNAPSAKAGITVEQAWVTNKAGFRFHNWYGFGLTDAAAAVAMAKTHVLLGAQKILDIALPKATSPKLDVPTTFTAAASTVETVSISYDDSGISKNIPYNCFQFELSSPTGTKSILINGGSGFSGHYDDEINFLSNAFYGENSAGVWSFLIKNICPSGTADWLNAAPVLTIRGR